MKNLEKVLTLSLIVSAAIMAVVYKANKKDALLEELKKEFDTEFGEN